MARMTPPGSLTHLSVLGGVSIVRNADGTVTATDPGDILSLLSAGWEGISQLADVAWPHSLRFDLPQNTMYLPLL
jgi:hypothetical protein